MSLNVSMKPVKVEDYLPHRPPLLLVDEVLTLKKNHSITARKVFQAKDMVFDGHFPGNPILPGMLCVEAMAQAGGVLVTYSLGRSSKDTLFYFASVESARFRAPIVPGETILFHTHITRQKGRVYKFSGKAQCADKTVAHADFTAQWVERT